MAWKTILCAVLAGAAVMLGAYPGQEGRVLVDLETSYNISGKDDIARIKYLMQGVGREFCPDGKTDEALRKIGIRKMRCINVDHLDGKFDENGKFIVEKPYWNMEGNLETCRAIHAIPHIVIGVSVPTELLSEAKAEGAANDTSFGLQRSEKFGPTDLNLYKNYWIAFFEYWVLEKGVDNAVFEIFNEPDIGGLSAMRLPKPPNGSTALYEDMFKVYRVIMQARREFEEAHPDQKLTVGAPAFCWAFTFGYGDFNWGSRFVRDCAEENLKPDFLGVHFYGNIAPLEGAYCRTYPTYKDQLISLASERDKYLPGVPIQINEWGPSYQCGNDDSGMVNATIHGALWALDFLKLNLELPVESMLYLVTTDLGQIKENGEWYDIYGWPSLFLNPIPHPGPVPKAMFHAFTFVSELEGERVLANQVGNVRCIAAKSPGKVQLLLWNCDIKYMESGKAEDSSKEEKMDILLRHAAKHFPGEKVRMRIRTVSETAGDVMSEFRRSGKFDPKAGEMPPETVQEIPLEYGALPVPLTLPPCSMSLVTLEALP